MEAMAFSINQITTTHFVAVMTEGCFRESPKTQRNESTGREDLTA